MTAGDGAQQGQHPSCSELGVFLDHSSGEEARAGPAATPVYIVIGHHQCCQLLSAVPCLVVNAQMHNISPTSQSQAQLHSRGSSVVFTALTQALARWSSAATGENLLETSLCLTETQQGPSSPSKAVIAQ